MPNLNVIKAQINQEKVSALTIVYVFFKIRKYEFHIFKNTMKNTKYEFCIVKLQSGRFSERASHYEKLFFPLEPTKVPKFVKNGHADVSNS